MSEGKLAEVREQFTGAVRALWWLTLLRGILLIVLGVYALVSPGLTIGALAQVIGFFMIIEGFLALWAGFSGQTSSRLWTIIRGIVLILAGLFVVAHPLFMAAIGATVVVYLVAIAILASGLAEIYVAIRDRHEIQGEGWLILGGVLSVILGLLLVIAPITAALFMVRVIGVFAIIAGIGLIVAAFRVRNFGRSLMSKRS